MHFCLKVFWITVIVFVKYRLKFPYSVEETAASFYTVIGPRCTEVKCSDEHLISTKCICSVFFYNIVRIDYISAWFTHLLAVFTEDHAVWCSLLVWFRSRHNTLIIEEFMPETWVEKMECSMLHTTVVPVNRKPVFKCLRTCKCLCICRVSISQEIPWWTRPLWHRICLSLCRASTARAGCIHPVCHCCKRWLSIVSRHIAVYLRK